MSPSWVAAIRDTGGLRHNTKPAHQAMKSGRCLDRIITVVRKQEVHTTRCEFGIGGLRPQQTSHQET
jgi:hypothetical protein